MADFRQFYGIDLPIDTDEDITDPERMSVLWHQLPAESRTARVADPSLEWTQTDYLLRTVEHDLRAIYWQRTKDGQRGRNAPKPLDTPAEKADKRRRADAALAGRDEIDRILGIK